VALTEMSWSLSIIFVVPLMGLLIARWGWRAPFPLLAGLGALAWVAFYRFLPGDGPGSGSRNAAWGSFRAVFTSTTALFGLAAGFCFNAANEVVNLVFGVWMGNAFHLDIAALGAASIVLGLAEFGGESLVGALTDRMGKTRAIAAGLAVNSLAALALPAVGNSLPGAFTALFVFYISSEFALVSFLPLMTEALPEARATLMAVSFGCLSLGRSLGALIGAPLYTLGIGASAVAAIVFNVLALLAARQVARRLAAPPVARKEFDGAD
jgi:predicted MFS family arabinose efflux permease